VKRGKALVTDDNIIRGMLRLSLPLDVQRERESSGVSLESAIAKAPRKKIVKSRALLILVLIMNSELELEFERFHDNHSKSIIPPTAAAFLSSMDPRQVNTPDKPQSQIFRTHELSIVHDVARKKFPL
jgi:hypothetical protein